MADDLAIIGIRTPLSDPKAVLEQARSIARERGAWVQLLDAEAVLGRDHLVSAFEHARRAFVQGRNTTESLEMEFLLYASGERQISKAISAAGARPGRPFVIVFPPTLPPEELLSKFAWERDDSLIDPTAKRLRQAGFSEEEIESAGDRALDLCLERVSRVDILK